MLQLITLDLPAIPYIVGISARHGCDMGGRPLASAAGLRGRRNGPRNGLPDSRIIGLAHGSDRRPNPPSGQRSTKLSPSTDDARVIVAWAARTMVRTHEPDGPYTKYGVFLDDLSPTGRAKRHLFRTVDPRAAGLQSSREGLNACFERDTLVLASQGLGVTPLARRRAGAHIGRPRPA
ncbi:hypothetical protein [Aureimonas mangrovi]|uniref:hypothetical protein n=1 Tax=Aureimonas mangrovi TaxID=2758041 RepID=UPI00163D92D2|nr:hypothetical protein [Aureimonas mangrovi]